MFFDYLWAFIFGGLFCMIAQILINFWLADKKEQLEKIEQEVSKGRSKAEIVKSINDKYPNIKNFFERGTD